MDADTLLLVTWHSDRMGPGCVVRRLKRFVIGDPATVTAGNFVQSARDFTLEETRQGRLMCLEGVAWWGISRDEPEFWVCPEAAASPRIPEGHVAEPFRERPSEFARLADLLRKVLEAEEVSGMICCSSGCGWVAPWDDATWPRDAEEACPHVQRCAECRGITLGEYSECDCSPVEVSA